MGDQTKKLEFIVPNQDFRASLEAMLKGQQDLDKLIQTQEDTACIRDQSIQNITQQTFASLLEKTLKSFSVEGFPPTQVYYLEQGNLDRKTKASGFKTQNTPTSIELDIQGQPNPNLILGALQQVQQVQTEGMEIENVQPSILVNETICCAEDRIRQQLSRIMQSLLDLLASQKELIDLLSEHKASIDEFIALMQENCELIQAQQLLLQESHNQLSSCLSLYYEELNRQVELQSNYLLLIVLSTLQGKQHPFQNNFNPYYGSSLQTFLQFSEQLTSIVKRVYKTEADLNTYLHKGMERLWRSIAVYTKQQEIFKRFKQANLNFKSTMNLFLEALANSNIRWKLQLKL